MKVSGKTLWFKAPAQSKTGVTPSQKSKVFYQNTLVYESVSISIKDNLYAYRKINIDCALQEKLRIRRLFIG